MHGRIRSKLVSRLTPLVGITAAGVLAIAGAGVAPDPPLRDIEADELERRFADDVRPVLESYCFDCHGPRRQKEKVRYDLMKTIDDIVSMGDTLAKARELLGTGEMPPEDEARPTDHEALVVLQWLDDALAYYPADGTVDPGWFTIHRLNRTEYRNTLRDLLGIDPRAVDLAEGLPPDDTGYGFDNIADVLAVSPMHLDRYLAAAERAIETAFGPLATVDTQARPLGPLTMSGNGAPADRGGFMLYSTGSVNAFFDAPIAGEYEIVAASWGTPGGDEDPRLSLRIDDRQVEGFWVKAEQGQSQDCRVRVNLEAGRHEITAHFTNDFYRRGIADRNLAVDSITAAGPLSIDDAARPPAYQRILGNAQELAKPGSARRIIRDFATRANRRPIQRSELEPLFALYRQALAGGESREGAIRLALTASLVSPRFLYRSIENPHPDSREVYRLGDYELASRLSYFLWSSMPDDELFDLAQTGQLNQDETLCEQVLRMLGDPKSDAFIENFVGQWLQLRNLDEIAFDRERFPEYDDQLRASMIQEARLFFADIVRSNRSVLDLIDSPDTFIDARLAELYDLPAVSPGVFEHVVLPQDSPRGGILTMAGVLAVTSYPTRTSPVRRGHFVLDQLLGMAPPPPPADIPPLEQASQTLDKNASLREQLSAHLTDPVCASCHRRMDPIGLAMENFGPTGAWRSTLAGESIDASGELPGGVAFQGVVELKEILLERESQIVENIARKIMTYALGRGPEPFDRPAISRIVRQTGEADNRFGALIEAVVLSESFRSCRGRSRTSE
jgi:uncharacterized protein DUF1592/uncharacterized protein DUF1588/uncharacterized protein DUF1587/uncharacterized protein DUF1585/uncharacterized protein DUF1595/predicted xylan-binding protein with Ca-dependent carbohydrate-binding module